VSDTRRIDSIIVGARFRKKRRTLEHAEQVVAATEQNPERFADLAARLNEDDVLRRECLGDFCFGSQKMTLSGMLNKRSRRTKVAVADIREAIRAVLKDDHPMTVRQVFYQLVVRDVIEKSEAEYQGTAIQLLTDMRLSGEIPWSHIIDASRRTRQTHFADVLNYTAKFYRRSALRQSDVYIEIWSGWSRTFVIDSGNPIASK
jgi:hypothetical protein